MRHFTQDRLLEKIEETRAVFGALVAMVPANTVQRRVLTASAERLTDIAALVRQRLSQKTVPAQKRSHAATENPKGRPPMAGKAAPTRRMGTSRQTA
jgi:hypothetical protein